MKRRMAQPLFVLSVAVTLVLALSVVVLSAQFQPIVPDIGFEIEGNTALDQGGVYDWENADYESAQRIPDPNSKIETDPTTFKPNSKFDDPAGWSIMPGKVGPGQSELVNFLHWDIKPGDLDGGGPNDHWLVLGMERIKTPGFFEMDFEYNQVAWDGTSGTLIRTPGDVLVGFELRGKPTSKRAEYKVLLLQYWPDAQPSLCSTTRGPGGEPELVEVGTDPCPLYSDSGWYYRLLADDALSAESGLVQATMNTESFAPPWLAVDGSGNPCGEIGPYQFAEAAINLTALGLDSICGSWHAKTRSAPHVQSDLKDLVGPVAMECAGSLEGHKFKDEDGDGLWDPDELPLEDWEIRLSDGSVTHTDSDGYYAFEDLDYGTYTVSEVCPQGEAWVQTAPTPNDPNSCGEAVYTVTLDSCNPEAKDLDFGNHWPGEIRLDGHKFRDYGDDLDEPNGIWDPWEPPIAGWEIRLSDGSVTHTDADGYYAFEDLAYGTYTVSEVCPQGELWEQTAPVPVFPLLCDGVYTVELNTGTPEVNDLDFGNSGPGPPPLYVTKDAQTSYTRTYQWTLEKTVDNPGPILLHLGEYADVEYQVVADSTYVDSWSVEGTITIENTGPLDVLLASVTDVITPDNIPVPVNCEEWLVPGLGSVTCSYGPVSLPDGSDRTNTATVTVQGFLEPWTATAEIVFDPDPIEKDEAATITDTNWEDEQWEDPEWFDVGAGDTPWVKTYPWRFHSTGDLCRLFDYPNTAVLITNDTNTVLTAEANVQIREACEGQVTIAYEDLPLYKEVEDPLYQELGGNDWDYNDLVIEVPFYLDVSDAGDLLAATFQVSQPSLSTAFTHTFNIKPYSTTIPCDGTYYTKTISTDGFVATGTGPYIRGDSFEVISNTLTAGNMDGFLAELRIDFNVAAPGDCPRDFGNPDLIKQYHGEWLFFDPWLNVILYQKFKDAWDIDDYEIHVRVTDDPEPRILTVPIAWTPPAEKVPIWDDYACVYPLVEGEEDKGPIFTPYWWNEELPFCME